MTRELTPRTWLLPEAPTPKLPRRWYPLPLHLPWHGLEAQPEAGKSCLKTLRIPNTLTGSSRLPAGNGPLQIRSDDFICPSDRLQLNSFDLNFKNSPHGNTGGAVRVQEASCLGPVPGLGREPASLLPLGSGCRWHFLLPPRPGGAALWRLALLCRKRPAS